MYKLIEATLAPENFTALAQKYVKEMSQYDPSVVWDDETAERVDACMVQTHLIEVDDKIIGFIQAHTQNIVPFDNMLIVDELYVSPEYRERKFGTMAVKSILKFWDGFVTIFIMTKNEAARKFWESVAEELNLPITTTMEIPDESGQNLPDGEVWIMKRQEKDQRLEED